MIRIFPAISFDCPCGPSDVIIEGKTGFLVPLGDVKKMSEKILELINNEELRIQMGKQAAIESSRFSTEKISEIYQELATLEFDIFLTMAYGQIIPQNILSLAKLGSFNIHASLLPKYRGAAPIQYAI